MAQSEPGSGQRTDVVSSTEPTPRGPRHGYLLLAISGVVLATAFGGIAQLAAPSKTTPGIDGGNDSPGSQQVAPHSTAPDTDSTTEDSSSTTADSSSSPTTTMSVGPDGRETVTFSPSSRVSKTGATRPPGGALPSGTTPSGGSGPTTRTTPPSSPPSSDTTTPPAPTTTTSITPTPSSGDMQR